MEILVGGPLSSLRGVQHETFGVQEEGVGRGRGFQLVAHFHVFHFGVFGAPILEPILVGLNRMFTGG